MKKLQIFLISLALIAVTAGCGNAEVGEVLKDKAPDFKLKDIKGNEFTLSDYAGKVIVLNFFATWCPPCRKEMPAFNEIAKEHKKDVEIIAINIGRESLPKVIEFANRYKLEFTIALDNGTASDAYGPINAIPVTVLINREFKISKRYIGMRSKETFVKDIEELL